MELLLLLVDQKGELVSRDQIVEKIWGNDIFLDTANSINGAIRKLRRVLKDDPDQPCSGPANSCASFWLVPGSGIEGWNSECEERAALWAGGV
jgi:hypothetical protein